MVWYQRLVRGLWLVWNIGMERSLGHVWLVWGLRLVGN
jgi:hypothetical protein